MTENFVLIDKPAGWTSFDVCAKLRSSIRAQYKARGVTPTKRQLRVGHAGTLDPFATGLLVVLLGDATKQAGDFLKKDKVYEAVFRLGMTSTTGDPEGDITQTASKQTEDCRPQTEEAVTSSKITTASSFGGLTSNRGEKCEFEKIPLLAEVKRVVNTFVGTITQTPPAYSAIKVGGKRAYKLAREGKSVDLPPRQVTIYSLELLDYTYPDVRVRAHVSSGTYIRSLAEDIGAALGVGAYCHELRRTRIEDFSVDDALTVEEYTVQRLSTCHSQPAAER